MRILSTIGLALRRLRRRPVRSFLLLQGTVWGVAVAIFPTAVIQGTRAAAVQDAEILGADRIVAVADPTSSERVELQRDDVEWVRGHLESQSFAVNAAAGIRVAGVMPAVVRGADPVTVLHTTPEGPRARSLELAAGRWLTSADTDACVIEARVAAQLGRPLAVGDPLTVEGTPRRIVGITKARTASVRSTNDLGFDIDHSLYKGVAQNLLMVMGVPNIEGDEWKRTDACVYIPPAADERIDWLYVRVDPKTTSKAARALREGLVTRSKTVITLHPIVLPMIVGDEVDRFAAVQIAMFLACLLMGAVVMANLGLLNALSRSREIAIRRVEGATRGDVAGHFLVEGLLLSLIGCALGCGLGMALAELRASLEPVAGFTWVFPTAHAAVACGVAIVIGLLAAVLPALRAASQDPVKGLMDD